jgi:hypothetical protein
VKKRWHCIIRSTLPCDAFLSAATTDRLSESDGKSSGLIVTSKSAVNWRSGANAPPSRQGLRHRRCRGSGHAPAHAQSPIDRRGHDVPAGARPCPPCGCEGPARVFGTSRFRNRVRVGLRGQRGFYPRIPTLDRDDSRRMEAIAASRHLNLWAAGLRLGAKANHPVTSTRVDWPKVPPSPRRDVHRRDLLCPLQVDSGRLLRARTGPSPMARGTRHIDLERPFEIRPVNGWEGRGSGRRLCPKLRFNVDDSIVLTFSVPGSSSRQSR